MKFKFSLLNLLDQSFIKKFLVLPGNLPVWLLSHIFLKNSKVQIDYWDSRYRIKKQNCLFLKTVEKRNETPDAQVFEKTKYFKRQEKTAYS